MAEFALVKRTQHDVYALVSTQVALAGAAKGRCVLITGAGTGIGKATAEAFAQASAKRIILVGRRLDVIAAVRDELSKRYPDCSVVAESCDVSQTNDVDKLFAKLKQDGDVDVLVNNAGVSLSVFSIKDSEIDAWWKTFEINVKGPYIMSRAFLRQHTAGKAAAIIMVTSAASYHTVPTLSSYAVSKVALNRVTEYISSESRADGVQAIAVHPGGVAGTEMTSKAPDYMQSFFTETAELAAGTIVYLSTPHATYLSGRYVDARWNLEELAQFKDRIESEDLLKMSMLGEARVRA